jgi:hypothetical protein
MQEYNSYGEWARANGVATVAGQCPECGKYCTLCDAGQTPDASGKTVIHAECSDCGALFTRRVLRIERGQHSE